MRGRDPRGAGSSPVAYVLVRAVSEPQWDVLFGTTQGVDFFPGHGIPFEAAGNEMI
jgi:hypothetical protein